MSSANYYIGRKRHRSPDPRDSSDSEDLPSKRQRNGEGLRLAVESRCQKLLLWIRSLNNVSGFFKMALRSGAEASSLTRIEEHDEDDSVDEEEEEEHDDDISIVDTKENFDPTKLFPETKDQRKPERPFSKYARCNKRLLGVNGSLGSNCTAHILNGFSSSSKITSTTDPSRVYFRNGDLKYSATSNLRYPAVVSEPATEVQIVLGSEQRGDRREIASNLPCSQKFFSSSPVAKHSVTSMGNSFRRTSSLQNDSSTPKAFTAHQVARLNEKEQYQQLLEKYIRRPPYRPIAKKPESDYERRADLSCLPAYCHFKKEVLEQSIEPFIEKYYKPCQLVTRTTPAQPSEKKSEPLEVVTIDDDDEEIKVLKDTKLPHCKARYQCTTYSKNWLTEFQTNVKIQLQERVRIVEEREKQLEEIKRKRILRQLKVDDVVPEAVEQQFPELTPEMEAAIEKVLYGGPSEEFICKITSDDLYRKDFDTLSGLKWLNDRVINSYFDLIVERSKQENYPKVYAYNTFFYSTYKSKGYMGVKRWTRKVNIFSYDLNFVPIHLGVHWCLAVIDHRAKKISYYDSMRAGEDQCLDLLHEYLCLEHKDKKGQLLDPTAYVTEAMKDIPQQMNGSDCGMFALKYAEYISRDEKIVFGQAQMHYFRRRMVYELLMKKIL